jgi:hypothetical protein
MSKKGRIEIPLQNGYKLVAEQNTDPNFSHELFVGITDGNGVWWQDLVIVRPAYAVRDNPFHPVEVNEDKFDVMVYSDAYNEDYTDKFQVDLYHGGV